MAVSRKLLFANDEFYHVFNRGIDRRPTFTSKREYKHALETMKYYQYADLPLRLSKYSELPLEDKVQLLMLLQKKDSKYVDIIAYCLMPNHFHFLLQQKQPNGVSKFLANFTNSYTKYFNAKNRRNGPLFQGLFKAVHIETNEQLLHVSRYIHLNPLMSFLVNGEELESYSYSSYQEYLEKLTVPFCKSQIILDQFTQNSTYKEFVMDQIAYAYELKKIQHLLLE